MLGVIGIEVVLEAEGADELAQGGSVEQEEQRAKNRTLRNPYRKGVFSVLVLIGSVKSSLRHACYSLYGQYSLLLWHSGTIWPRQIVVHFFFSSRKQSPPEV